MSRTHPARPAFGLPRALELPHPLITNCQRITWVPLIPRVSLIVALLTSLLGAPSSSLAAPPDEGRANEKNPSSEIDFTQDIRPILSNHCFKCHGPDEATREAGLRLDTAEGATENFGGYRPIEPGDAEASEVVARLTSDDEDLRMPPAGSGLELSPAQIQLLTDWIDAGAEYDLHWSFAPIDRSGPASIDSLIDSKLRSLGLERSPRADRTTQIRRLYLDLLGVAPPPGAVGRFVRDQSPDAYRRLVDRLLADPRFGEKWGRHWLDQARYADTHGYTIDSPRTMWPYRDWVINAINSDMPFDRFTIEQLAGDLLPEPSLSQQVASGFHRNTLINQEGGTDKEQFRNEVAVDRVNTTGAVWMGLTVGCAQCHTHKFDPLTHREYYQLFAFFNQAEDANGVAPTVPVPTADQQRQLDQLKQRLDAAQTALREYEQSQTESSDTEVKEPAAQETPAGKTAADEPWTDAVRWVFAEDATVESDAGTSFERLDDGSWLAQGENGDRDTYRVSFRLPGDRVTGLRLETLTHPSLPRNGPGRASNGNFVLNEIELTVEGKPVKWVHATADHSQKNYDVAAAIDGDESTGWAINGGSKLNADRAAVFVNEPIERNANGDDPVVTVTMTFGDRPATYNIGRFRLAVTDVPSPRLGVPDPQRLALEATRDRARKAWDKARGSIPNTMVMRDAKTRRESFIHIRGDFLRHGESVSPGTPAVLPPLSQEQANADDTRPATRLDLARWLVDPSHPLTARVTVNRIWMRLFGRGLVETENDFGLQGTTPTHPRLLDRLAGDWIDGGWSRKRLIRRIVLSETYRQSSRSNPESDSVDPLNQYLSRQSRIRVDAEIVRDLALSASGLIDRTIGGPSVYPPQPDGVYAFTQRSASWPESAGGDRYRRGMYTFFMRSAPHPMLTTFDSPSFNTTCTRRVRSNTPLQSLTMANDVAMIEAARGMASRLLRDGDPQGDDRDLVTRAFRIAFSRDPDGQELDELTRFLERQRRAFSKTPDQAARLAGVANTPSAADGEDDEWHGPVGEMPVVDRAAVTMLARVLMNLDEFITRE